MEKTGINIRSETRLADESPRLMYPSMAFSYSRYGLMRLAASRRASSAEFQTQNPAGKEKIK